MSCMFVRTHVDFLREHKRSGAVLFADLKSAFYSVVREFVLPMASTEESTIDDLIDSVPLLLVPAVQQLIMQPSVIES
eukprot:3008631-Karenia_brevis.AAC.1